MRSIAIRQKELGNEHLAVASMLDDYAGLLEVAGRPEEAALIKDRAEKIRESVRESGR
jgi:hypothetical protein